MEEPARQRERHVVKINIPTFFATSRGGMIVFNGEAVAIDDDCMVRRRRRHHPTIVYFGGKLSHFQPPRRTSRTLVTCWELRGVVYDELRIPVSRRINSWLVSKWNQSMMENLA